MRHKPGLFFITNSSNKAFAAAILLDMQNNAIPLSFVSFYFKLHFTTFQKKVLDILTCVFTQNRTRESNMNCNCTSTYSALKLIEEMFYQPLKTRVKMVLLFNVQRTKAFKGGSAICIGMKAV